MSNSMIVADGLEPEVRVPEEALQQEMEEVDTLLSQSLLTGDPSPAFGYIRDVKALGQIKGLGVARILYSTWQDWPKYQTMGIEDDWENVAPAMSGLSLDQCRKYRDLVRDVYENPAIPEHVKSALIRKPIEAQMYVRPAAKDGDLTEDDWENIANAVTVREVRDLIRAKRGELTSAGKRMITVVERHGGLVKTKEGEHGKYVVWAALRNSRNDLEGDDYEHRVRSVMVDRFVRYIGAKEQ